MKQITGIFPQSLMNDLTCAKLKETVNLQDIIKNDNLNHKSNRGKNYNLLNRHYVLFFKEMCMKDIYH